MLKVLINTTDYSRQLKSYLDEGVTHTLLASDKLYIGYKKPIKDLYIEMSLLNAQSVNMSVKYYNGTAFDDVEALYDTTYQLTRSGFLAWESSDSEAATTIEGSELYWYEITVDADADAITFDGIGLILSSDFDLEAYEPQINASKYYPSGKTSFINFHEGTTSEIIQRLRNQGKGVWNGASFQDLTVFDLNRPEQLKVASVYMVLSKIFFNRSDSTEDKYYQKFMDYRRMHEEAFNVFFLSIDKNGDGKEGQAEQTGIQYKTIKRI